MVEHNGVLVHLDPQGDRTADGDLKFEGWVAASRPITSVSLAAESQKPFRLGERPDVCRVLPGRFAVGFAGTSGGSQIQTGNLRLRVQIEEEVFEVDHPVPSPLPKPKLRSRVVGALRLSWLKLRQRLTSDPWRFVLARHLFLRRQRSNIFRRPHTEALLLDFAIAVPQAVLVQIGANDGLTGDPIHHLLVSAGQRWRGVLVEPVAHLFQELRARYSHNPTLHLERAVIAESDGTAVIYRLERKESDSLWLEQLASLDEEVLRENARQFGVSDPELAREEVPALTVATLLQRHHLTHLDLIIIDTEGWDWRILRQFDLNKLRPKLILYEHQHLSAEARAQAHEFLARASYDWAETPEGDTLAWRKP